MSSEWIETTLGEVLTLQRGIDLPVQDRRSGSVPVVASTGIVGFHNEAPVKGPGVVIGRSGSIGGGQFIRQDFWPLNTTLWVKDFHGNDPRYCYYLLRSMDFSGLNAGSGVPTLNRNHLHPLKVRRPPIDRQRAIANTLGGLDDKIDLNRHINQTLEAIAQALFKSWFVDFDPVRAKIAAKQEGRDPLRAAMSAISGKPDAELDALPPEQYEQLAAIAALFPDEMEESELGEIPKGWSCGALGDICSFTAGSAFKPEHQGSTEGDYPFIKVSDMNLAGNEVFIQSANNYVSKAQQSEMKAKLHPVGATVFAKIGVALISNRRRLLTSPTIIDNNLMSASPVEGKSGQYFFYSLLSTLDFNTLVSGTALPYINVSDLKKIPIVRPPSEACRAFEAKASSIFSMMQTLAAQSSTLATTRDVLLPKLLSGEIETSGTFEG
ncbi:restriction endonuclease subunit S [Thauera sp. AutoDN2]|uniref:restriction endonuclease subunit S n=1 Tax=Thauera sp. AutoDN2 TaxID=3416051 RepID=UPI003F4B0C76